MSLELVAGMLPLEYERRYWRDSCEGGDITRKERQAPRPSHGHGVIQLACL